MTTMVEQFKDRRKSDYDSIWEFINIAQIAQSIDPNAYVHKNEADRAEIVFTDGSKYVISNNG